MLQALFINLCLLAKRGIYLGTEPIFFYVLIEKYSWNSIEYAYQFFLSRFFNLFLCNISVDLIVVFHP